jgi:hypothetical protein
MFAETGKAGIKLEIIVIFRVAASQLLGAAAGA